MLLDAEKKNNPMVAKMEKQIEKADAAVSEIQSVPEQNESTDINDILNAPAEEPPAEKKKTRSKSRKKKSDEGTTEQTESVETEEASEDPVVTEEASIATEAEVNDVANQQEAPFPDIAMNPPEEATQVSEPVVAEQAVAQDGEQPIGADFRMFDEEEEAF